MHRLEKILELKNQGYKQGEIAKILGVSQSTISRIINNKIKSSKFWTEEEIDILHTYYGAKSLKKLSELLGRSEGAVLNKRNKMKLGPSYYHNEFLTIKDLERSFKVSSKKIKQIWISEHGLNVNERVLIREKRYSRVRLDVFWRWANNNKEIIDFSKLEKGALGKEPKWVEEKRLKDSKNNTRKYKKHYSTEEDNIIRMYHNHKSYREIADILQRSKKSVESRARRLNLKYKQVIIPWSQLEINMLISLTNEGYNCNQIGNELGRSRTSVVIKKQDLVNRGVLL